MVKFLLDALRSSEFWGIVGQVVIEVVGAPVPDEFKAMGWVYIGFRVASKLVKYLFPNPANPGGGWFKKD